MKYMVLTTKHHDGFCLWDSDSTDYCSAKMGPGRDLVAEYVAAARAERLKVGFYYSLMDWHHPDGYRCIKPGPARRRFVDYTHGLVRELMTNYGKIDILWYDVAFPLKNADEWESRKMNAMARKLQPDIIINNRSLLDEDFGTPEESIVAEAEGRNWEACMTFNGSWGWVDTPDSDWHSERDVIMMLRQVTAQGGNLLLNVGPKPDGTLPRQAHERLGKVGKWLDVYGKKLVYGDRPRTKGLVAQANIIDWTCQGKTAYAWLRCWPGTNLGIGWFKGRVKSVKLLTPQGSKRMSFKQEPRRLVVTGLPRTCPEKAANIAVLQIDCASKPTRRMGIHTDNAEKWWE